MMLMRHDPRSNSILHALSPDEFELIAPSLELISKSSGDVLYEVNEKLQYVYFPVTATASLLCGLEDGSSVEVAVVGNEGMLGISTFMGGETALTQATISATGDVYRMRSRVLRDMLDRIGGRRGAKIQYVLMRYTQTLLLQMAQTTACNRRHSVKQQLCRWLLLNFDRMDSSKLAMTQELISNILGVRRESITEIAGKLKSEGIIRYDRGIIEITNREGLEEHVCECYSILKNDRERLAIDLLAA